MQATNAMIQWAKRRIEAEPSRAVFSGILETELGQTFSLSFPDNIKACQNMVERRVFCETKSPTFYLLP